MPSPQRRATRPTLRAAVAAVALVLCSEHLPGQAPAQPATPAVNVSGLIFGNYQYHLSGQSKDFNQFVVDRAYINVRATISERMSIRVTTDVFQSGDQNGWTIRAKYAYLQYDAVRAANWRTA